MKNLFTILFISLFIFSCDKDNPISSDDYFTDFVYPINIGNEWIYEGYFNREMYDIDLSEYNLSINRIDSIIIDSMYSEIDNIFRFKTIVIEDGQNIGDPGFQYISNSSEGLLHHGYENPNSTILPLSVENNIKYKINGQILSFNELLNLIHYGSRDIIWDGPLLSIKYPLISNSQWTYRTGGNPMRMDRLITEMDDNQFVIKTLYDINDDLSWDDNINVTHTYSKNGLISYNVVIDSMEIFSEFGENIGFGSLITNMILINHTIE